MKNRILYFICLLIILLIPIGNVWAQYIPADRSISWSPGIPGGIPDGYPDAQTTGYIASGTPTLYVASATGFSQGDSITVVGAGPSGVNLNTTISAISGNVLTLAANASTTVPTANSTASSGVVSQWPICSVIDAATYGNGITDATTVINNALSACADTGTVSSGGHPEVVYLPAGTYLISSSLNLYDRSTSDYNGVVLRGAGPANTKIIYTGTGNIFRLGSSSSTGYPLQITGSISSGSALLTVNSIHNMAVGDWISIANGISSGIPFNTTISSISNTITFSVSGVVTAPTTGATYTNNYASLTVVSSSITGGSGTIVFTVGSGTPYPNTGGTLVKTGGTGDSSISYSMYSGQVSLASSSNNTSINNGIVSFSPYTASVTFSGNQTTIPKGSTSITVGGNTSKILAGSYIVISQDNPPGLVNVYPYGLTQQTTVNGVSDNELTVNPATGYTGYTLGNYVTVQNGASTSSWDALTGPITSIPSSNTYALGGVNLSSVSSGDIVYQTGYCNYCGDDNPNSVMGQIVQVTAVNSNTLTLNRPLYYDLDESLQPTVTVLLLTQESGIENLYLHPMQGNDSPNILMEACANCWVANIESDTAGEGNGAQAIEMYNSYASVVRDSYIHDAYSHESGSGYGVWVFGWNSDHLIENNIFRRMRHSMIFEGGGSGVVFGYNYSLNNIESLCSDNYSLLTPIDNACEDEATAGWDDNAMAQDSTTHGAFPYMDLYEGNVSSQLNFDNAHGNSAYITAFRNYFPGVTTNPTGGVPVVKGSSTETFPVIVTWGLTSVVDSWESDYENVADNVLGVPNCGTLGNNNNYATYATSTGNTTSNANDSDYTVYMIGYYTGSYSDTPILDPNLTSGSTSSGALLRYDNYNCIDQGVHSAENSGLTIPSSLYYSSTPSWWGTLPWPAIGHELVSQAATTYGAGVVAGMIPAEQRYLAMQAAGTVHMFPGDLTGDINPAGVPLAMPTTVFYVDSSVSTNGSGTQNSPWKLRGNINWTTIQTALNSGNVTIYFSSRSTWSDNQQLTIGASSPTNTLTLDGSSEYNNGTSWVAETNPNNRAVFTNSGGTGGTLYINSNTSNVTIKGINFQSPTWGGVIFNGNATNNTTVNVNNITIDNIFVNLANTTLANSSYGVYGGFITSGSSNIIVKNSTIENTPLEGIYIGHYNDLTDSIPGIIVQNNTMINVGTNRAGGAGTATINIKPPDVGAIVRNNVIYETAIGAGCGIFDAADQTQVYDNTIYGFTHTVSSACAGHGIFLNSDGDGVGNGRAINSAHIYNNLIYGNDGSGIAVSATTSTEGSLGTYVAGAQGIDIENNTLWGNSNGLSLEATTQTVQIAELMNNILGDNVNYEINKEAGSGTVEISNASNNLYYRPSGNSTNFSFTDSSDLDINPFSTNSAGDFHLTSTTGSPVGAGTFPFTTSAVGTGKTITLNSVISGMYASNYFLPGESIEIQGVGVVTVASVPPYPSEQITLTTSVSWAANKGVGFPWISANSSNPDLGAPIYNLTINATNGSVAETINGGVITPTSFISGAVVTLTATPASGYNFTSWTNCTPLSGIPNECTVTMNTNQTVTANFTASSNTLYGDVINTGKVTIYDAELTAQYAIGLTVANFLPARAKVDGNSNVDIYDAYLIAEYAIGLINKFAAVQP